MGHIRRIEQLSFEKGEGWTGCETVVKLWLVDAEAGAGWRTHYFTMPLALAEVLGKALLDAAQNGMAHEKATK